MEALSRIRTLQLKRTKALVNTVRLRNYINISIESYYSKKVIKKYQYLALCKHQLMEAGERVKRV
jgi:hypothetical protein